MNSWMLLKVEAEKIFQTKDYQKACDHYKDALTDIETKLNERKPDLNEEAAKITSNLSLLNLKLSKEQNDESLLLESKEYAKKTISYNPNWIKGYLRLKEACKQSNNEEDILNSITAYLHDNKDAIINEDFKSLLKEVDYYKTIMMSSPSWDLVEYKDNVYLVDPLGAGHFKHFKEFINCHGLDGSLQRISVLVRPGVYEGTFYFINASLDIVGDCNVEINSSTKAIDKDPAVIFTNTDKETPEHAPITFFFIDCKVSLKRISVYSEEFRAIACQSTEIKLIECSFSSKCSDSLACYMNTILNCESCRSVGGYGGVLIGSESHATLTDCFISKMKRIGIQAIDDAEMTSLKHCTVTKCNLQGLLVFNGAKQAKILDSHFEDNCAILTAKNPSIEFKGCRALVKRTYVKSNNNCGINISDGSGHFDKVVIENCVIGMSVKANVVITNCNIISCSKIGIQILKIVKGGVVLENNNITKCSYEIARMDKISAMPTFKGGKKNSIKTFSCTDMELEDNFKEIRKSQRKSAKGTIKGLNVLCGHCGLQVEHLTNKLKACSKCQMAYYCSSECQQKEWKFHQRLCECYVKTKLAAREEKLAIETIQEYTNENNTMSRTNETEGNDISIDHLDEIGATAEVTEVKSDDRNDVTSNIPEWKRKNKKKKKKGKSNF